MNRGYKWFRAWLFTYVIVHAIISYFVFGVVVVGVIPSVSGFLRLGVLILLCPITMLATAINLLYPMRILESTGVFLATFLLNGVIWAFTLGMLISFNRRRKEHKRQCCAGPGRFGVGKPDKKGD